MDEVALNESMCDLTDAEKETEQQLRRLSEKVRSTPRRALGDITNSSDVCESPKSHVQPVHSMVSHSQSTNALDAISRQSSFCEAKLRRKRFCRPEQITIKRRRETTTCSPVNENEEDIYDEGSMSISLMRTHSTSYIESGPCARDHNLPGLLKVEYSLCTMPKPQIDSSAFKSIEGATLALLMDSTDIEVFEKKFLIVDCRYPYEYNGGHIRGAVNIHDPSLMPEVFFPKSAVRFDEMLTTIPIFYCEFSQKRGPAMAEALRQYDRLMNASRYPEVDYKEIYVLDRGYRKFFSEDKLLHLCAPSSYVPMVDPEHKDELKKYSHHLSKTRSCGALSCFRPGGGADLKPRRTRLTFRSVSIDDTSPSSKPRRPVPASLFRSPKPSPGPGTDLYGSPFPQPDSAKTPPQTNANGPIQMANFS